MAENDLKTHKKEIEEWVQSAQKGDMEAFSRLYDLLVNPIYRYIAFKVPKEEAMDLTETVFLRVWEHLQSYKANSGQFSSWVFRIAHNLVVDYYRLHRQHASIDEVVVVDENREADPKKMAENKINQAILKSAIGKLKKKYQQVLLLKYISGLESREIARLMHRTEGSLRILKFRALQSLKKVLEEMGIKY